MNKAKIRLDQSMDHPVLYIEGDVIGNDPEFITREINKIENPGEKKIFIDFTKTQYINSSGIALLIQLIQKSNDEKYTVEFCGVSTHFFKIFDLVGMTELVNIHNKLSDAF